VLTTFKSWHAIGDIAAVTRSGHSIIFLLRSVICRGQTCGSNNNTVLLALITTDLDMMWSQGSSWLGPQPGWLVPSWSRERPRCNLVDGLLGLSAEPAAVVSFDTQKLKRRDDNIYPSSLSPAQAGHFSHNAMAIHTPFPCRCCPSHSYVDYTSYIV